MTARPLQGAGLSINLELRRHGGSNETAALASLRMTTAVMRRRRDIPANDKTPGNHKKAGPTRTRSWNTAIRRSSEQCGLAQAAVSHFPIHVLAFHKKRSAVVKVCFTAIGFDKACQRDAPPLAKRRRKRKKTGSSGGLRARMADAAAAVDSGRRSKKQNAYKERRDRERKASV